MTLQVCVDQKLQLYCMYSGSCILRPPLQPGNCGVKLEVVLKCRDIDAENIRVVSLVSGPKMEGIVIWRGLKIAGTTALSNVT